MSFAGGADAYDRFMGRYSGPLAPAFADFAGITGDQTVLDVGCGPGALTAELIARAGPSAVTAVDPTESFVAAAHERFPTVDVRLAAAEELPFGDGAFDAALAQLVVHFMGDPVAGLREMARVTRAGGVVAACVWSYDSSDGPLTRFWRAVRAVDPRAVGESDRPGTRAGHLGELFRSAGIDGVHEGDLTVSVVHPTFEDWWEPFTLGVGPAGTYVAGLDPAARDRLREQCREMTPTPPFTLRARAYAARGVARHP